MYRTGFYRSRDEDTRTAAEHVLPPILEMIGAASACDVGCGVGTWLAVAYRHGISDIAGFEGPWLDKTALVIDPGMVESRDLEIPISPARRFDIAICLEVAEHLTPKRGPELVKDLTDLSDVILFSAAIPDQGGVDHRNEKWQSYWAGLFDENGYDALDIIRPAIWSNEAIPVWYRQNAILYARRASPVRERLTDLPAGMATLDIVHPRLYLKQTQPGPKQTARLVIRAAKRLLTARRRHGFDSD